MSNESPPSGTPAILAPPTEELPKPGRYRAAEGRCILEISAALGPLTTLRGRFAVLDNSLVVAETGDRAALSLEASVPSLRTTRPLAGRRVLGRHGLDARHHGLLRLQADRISTVDETYWRIRAELTIRATPIDITMQARITACEEDRIALIATGAVSSRTLRETCTVRLPRSVPADGVRLTFAADFR
jgi:polyisoprenoid-binding protein YceI